MSDYTIVIIQVVRIFLYSSSVYSCHLFLISSASVRSIPFLSFIEPIFAWNVPLVSFCCFPLFLCIDHWGRFSYLSLLFFGTLHSNGYIFPFLLCFLLPFFSQLFVRWPQDWKRSVFIPIPKKGNAKECSNYRTIALISHASKVMLKILQARLQQYMNRELPDVQAGFRKGRGTRDQIANIRWIMEKSKRVPENHLFLLYWLCQSLWLCGSQ